MNISTIGLIMTLALGVLAAPLPTDAQPAGNIRRYTLRCARDAEFVPAT
jgi:hypothetical protein